MGWVRIKVWKGGGVDVRVCLDNFVGVGVARRLIWEEFS